MESAYKVSLYAWPPQKGGQIFCGGQAQRRITNLV